MLRRLGVFAVCLAVSSGVFADAHSDGLTFGKGQLDGLANKVSTTPTSKLPFYTSAPSQSSGYSSGIGLAQQGIGRINTCKTATHGSDRVANQECDAVNFLAKNPTVRKRIDVSPNDPILLGAADTMANAKENTSTNGCVTKTTTTPAEYSTEVCNEFYETHDEQCTMGQVVEVDVDANFQCDVTYKSYETLSCRRGNSVTVGYGKCSPGALLTSMVYNTCPRCIDPYVVMDVFCDSAGTGYRTHRFTSRNGASSGLYADMGWGNVAVSLGQSTGWVYTGDYGQGCHFYFYYSQSCSSTACTPGMYVVSQGCNGSTFSTTGTPIAVPIEKTLTTWKSNDCATLEERAQ